MSLPAPNQGYNGHASSQGDPEEAMALLYVLGLPVEGYSRMQQYHDELLREFKVLSLASTTDRGAVPGKLLALVREVEERFSNYSNFPRSMVASAAGRGEGTVDLVYPLQVSSLDTLERLEVLLGEADEYCREGALLTLRMPEDVRRLRTWYFDQVLTQLVGGAPTRWGEHTEFSGAPTVEVPQRGVPQSRSSAVSRVFSPEATTPRDARHYVAECIRSWGHEEAAETAELLTSEVVTNAVLHAQTQTRVEVALSEDYVLVSVGDASERIPSMRQYGTEASTGRGMQMVELLSESWGVERRDGGKVVWFRLAL